MTGKESKPVWEVRIETDEDKAKKLVERLGNPPWALEERNGKTFLLLFFSEKPSEESFKGLKYLIRKTKPWQEVFRETFKGRLAGRFFIRPPWVPEKEEFTNIVIYPGSGFGTGEHETTRIMLKLIEEFFERNSAETILDVGTGSGILAIACEKLSPSSFVLAIDKDPLAIENAKENLKYNGSSRIRLSVATPEALKGQFDLVLANLDFFTLLENFATLSRLVSSGGSLIISGFLTEDEETIIEIFASKGLKVFRKTRLGEWSGCWLKN